MAAKARLYDSLIASYTADHLGFDQPTTLEAGEAWKPLEDLHSKLASRAQGIVASRGSAEYLWFLRRLRGQFQVNTRPTTDTYVQALAESLVCGSSRESSPVDNDQGRFVFYLSDDVFDDLYELRELSLRLYEIQSAMKRCAKGQRIVFRPDANPWPPTDDPLNEYISDFDKRAESANDSLLRTVGLATEIELDPSKIHEWNSRIGGVVPLFFSTSWPLSNAPSSLAEPPPIAVQHVDLDLLPPLVRRSTLNKDQVALIALLWAAQNDMTRERDHAGRRLLPALQWGYALMPDNRSLEPALEEICEWMQDHHGRAIHASKLPQSAGNLRETLKGITPELWPPLPGAPIHGAGELAVVDLVAASLRLYMTLLRPSDGADANFWSTQFERDVQSIIDNTAWRPPDALRSKVGSTIRRADGTAITDIDALGQHRNTVLLVSCKSPAFTIPTIGGSHNAVRAITSKVQEAVDNWGRVLEEVREKPDLVGASRGMEIVGCVVFPAVPFTPIREHHRRVLRKLRYVCSSSELEAVLSRFPQ